jgi:hypothetical protein
VDEDCFTTSGEVLKELIAYLDGHPEIGAAGIPDGGHFYRRKNAAAVDLFFVVFRGCALREAWARMSQRPAPAYDADYGVDVLTQRPELDEKLIDWNGVEPYYPVFWALRRNGHRFLRLKNAFVESRSSTRVLAPSGTVVAEHLWYLRQWFSRVAMPGSVLPNPERHDDLKRELLQRYGRSASYRVNLLTMQVIR